MSIPHGISTVSPASCRPMHIAAATSCTPPRVKGQSPPTSARPMRDGSSSSWQTSPTNARGGKNASAISPIALEALKRIDALFDIERSINGQSTEEHLRVRRETECAASGGTGSVAAPAALAPQAPHRLPNRLITCCGAGSGARFINNGRICLTNNAAGRALRGFVLGRKSWLFAGSERGAERAAFMATLVMTAKVNNVDPQAWLADLLARIGEHSIHRPDELLPWNWAIEMERCKLAA
jgi:transposase